MFALIIVIRIRYIQHVDAPAFSLLLQKLSPFTSFSSFLLIFFQNSAPAISSLIKVHKLCDTVAFFHASHP
jgi:hypothetical protein